MTLLSIMKKEDYLDIKWQIVFAVFGIVISTAIFLGAGYLADESLRDLRISQSEFDGARSRVESIEDEEATIIEYIERYQVLAEAGVVEDENRLLMHEWIAEIRSEFDLSPVALNINEQTTQTLPYPSTVREPGDPVALRSSIIGLTLPLLHEEDLTRLLDSLLKSPGLFQTKLCSIQQQNPDVRNFIVLSNHFTANCEILWYTFDLDPPLPPAFGF